MAEVRLKAPVRCTIVEDIHDRGVPAGAIEYSGNPIKGLWYQCPCGCGSEGFLTAAENQKPQEPPSWMLTGPRDAPTLSPSINHVGHWHGWLRGGLFEQA